MIRDDLSGTEARVAQAMGEFGCLPVAEITRDTAMAQDAYIDGIDVDDFVGVLHDEFGEVIRDIPWLSFSDQRASFRGCAVALLPFWLIARVFVRPSGESILARPGEVAYPRLTVGHIAQVIDQGYWTQPEDMAPYPRTPFTA
ncbi:hypothetical protein [Sphingomonas sp.]|uniref:hypothetical protein n=1 Tax=Sphingomonas sp. TaxID=28214 RepID=UPI002DD6BA53|nr:hypothetical protein [Sphingomonas sp.]